jgi:hypothetical protein
MGEMGDILLGRRLGYGAYRQVYQCTLDESLVIKVANSNYSRTHNILEYHLWFEVYSTKYAAWLAPCVSISSKGKYLIQKRVDAVPKMEYQKRVPEWFTDLKYGNFGLYLGRFVCCDYAGLKWDTGMSSKTVVAQWWSD